MRTTPEDQLAQSTQIWGRGGICLDTDRLRRIENFFKGWNGKSRDRYIT